MNREELLSSKRAYYLINKARIKAYARAFYLKNKATVMARVKTWQENNRGRKNAGKRRRYAEAHDHFITKSREYAAKRIQQSKAATYRELNRAKQRRWSKERTAAITDDYAREQLSKYSNISASTWPQELVDVKKTQIAIKRLAYQ